MTRTGLPLPEGLAALCRRIGAEHRDWVILGEGNAAAVDEDGHQWVTVSGSQLAATTSKQLLRLDPRPILDTIEAHQPSEEEWTECLRRAGASGVAKASIEAPMHVVAAHLTGATWSAHTHPTAALGLLASTVWRDFAESPLFPDQVVVCGPAMCTLEYVDPGFALARATTAAMRDFRNLHGIWPRVMLMQNHGLLALGSSPEEVEAVTQMALKAAVVWTTAALLGATPMRRDDVHRIHNRDDEQVRRSALKLSAW